MNSFYPDAALVAEHLFHLGGLARQFRGAREDGERRRLADDYARTVARLVETRAWDEMPPPEDQLPLDWMPPQFFAFWSPPEPAPPAARMPRSRAVG